LAEFENISRFDEPTIYTNAQFILRNSKSREKFESELRSKGLKDIYKVTINESEYNKVVSPVEQITTISFVSMYVILITGTILLTMISILSLKDIKYEIGVLRAIGISKFKVAQGYLYEGIIITIICLILGMGIASVSAQPIYNEIFKNQIQITQKIDEQPIVEDMPPGNFRNVDNDNSQKEIKSIKLILTQESILKTIVISIFLSLIISMVAIYNAIIYKPIQIIFDRN
ncbi:ABC transporter permease, partial [Romboutsia weinsteinii]